ncbi:MAG: AI-2E family transporter [Patescibacteria group bacterium]|nr:AI-2E family transporter [Patescibacteria group bacterium]
MQKIFEENPLLKLLATLLSIIAGLYLFQLFWSVVDRFSDIILIVFLSWLLSFILEPIIKRLTHLGTPRIIGALFAYLLLAVVLIGASLLLLPVIITQLNELSNRLPELKSEMPKWVGSLQTYLASRGVEVNLTSAIQARLIDFSNVGFNLASQLVSILTSIFSVLFSFALVLIISFYFALDGERIKDEVVTFFPKNWVDDINFVSRTTASSFAGFIRGQVILALISGLLTWVILTLLGVSFAAIAAVTAGILTIIPIIGGPLALIPPLLAAFLSTPNLFWIVLVITLVLQQIEFDVFSPLILKQTIGLHPVWVLIAFLVGLKVGGGWGALFAVPVAGVLWTIGKEILKRREEISKS